MQITEFDMACVMERLDALHLERQVAAHRQLYPDRKAESMEIAGGIATFTEASYGRKLNHVAGSGMLAPFDHDQIDHLEQAYRALGLRAEFDLCTHAKPHCLEALARRGFTVNAFSNSYALKLAQLPALPAAPGGFTSRIADRHETREQWARMSVAAFSHIDAGRSAALAEVLARNTERAGFRLAYTKPTFVAPLKA